MDYIGKLLKQTVTWSKLAKSECFSCFETKLKQALEKVKIPDPISGVSKHWNSGLYREIIETDWNMKKIGQVRTFQLNRNVSKKLKQALEKVKIRGPISSVLKHWNNGLYREIIERDWNISKQNWNKLWKRWKYQAPFLVFRNTETMDYIGKLLKRTETWI